LSPSPVELAQLDLYIKLPKCWDELDEERTTMLGWVHAFDDTNTGK
jgi:hypothetical protein